MKKQAKDDLGNRMKSYYENRFRTSLPRRTNVIIRIDGKAFHTYTRGFKRPYDLDLMEDMNNTTKYLCENIQGAKMGYVQSDEISILLTDYDTTATDAWFDYNIQKITSVAASMATSEFNRLRMLRYLEHELFFNNNAGSDEKLNVILNDRRILELPKQAEFDARVFVIPYIGEVQNYFVWRQQDATRNSISMAAQSMFSTSQLHGKKTNDMQDMMMKEKQINWNNYPTRFKRGSSIIKAEEYYKKNIGVKGPGTLIDADEFSKLTLELFLNDNDETQFNVYTRTKWIVDNETPIFTQDKDYIVNQLPGIEL